MGEKGEAIACQWLTAQGYQVVDQNLHYRGGELDIVARNPQGTLVFVEVKTRNSNSFGHITESISKRKVGRMLTAVQCYFAEHGAESEWQLDFLGIELHHKEPHITHIEHITA